MDIQSAFELQRINDYTSRGSFTPVLNWNLILLCCSRDRGCNQL